MIDYCKNSYTPDENKELLERYPFMLPRNCWTGMVSDDYDYSYTLYDEIPLGWRIAFGKDLLEDIRSFLIKAQEEDSQGGYAESYITTNFDSKRIIPFLEGYSPAQIKEKYGSLRWYDNGAPEGLGQIINKYELLSECFCINCGKSVRHRTKGWINFICEDCASKYDKDGL